ncbi:MAG: ZIP family metal transporter [Halioglobus sp.]|nr:ZIP family metal transporter [Halioglobus sp.]
MTASPTLLLAVYCLAVTGFSLLGGWLPNRVRMTHTRTQLVMSFVSGLMLGVAFYHLLPHSMALAEGPGAADFSVWWLMVGLIAMFLLLRTFYFHRHDFSREDASQHGHTHRGAGTGHAHGLSWVGVTLGLGLHSLTDGVALGAVMHGAAAAGPGLAGIGVFLAVLLHKPLDALAITTLMKAGGWSGPARNRTNILFALLCPAAAILFYCGVDLLPYTRSHVVAGALAFSAGTFICIALSDLLPEVHFHSHDRVALTLVFLLGIALAYAVGGTEPAGTHLQGH